MTVYVPQEVMYKNEAGLMVPKFDLQPAREHGDIKILLPGGPVMMAPQPMVRRVRQDLLHFNDADYILPTGDPIAIGIVMAIAADHNRGRIKLLRWSREHRRYNIIKVNTKGSKYDD